MVIHPGTTNLESDAPKQNLNKKDVMFNAKGRIDRNLFLSSSLNFRILHMHILQTMLDLFMDEYMI